MEKKSLKMLKNLPVQLLISIVLGILAGPVLPEGVMTDEYKPGSRRE